MKLRCTIHGGMVEDWAMYEISAPLIFKIPKKRVAALPGDNVCGSCVSHSRKLGLVTDQAYKQIAAKVRNVKERERTAHEFTT